MQNPYDGEIRTDYGGRILTGNQDGRNHRIGLASIQRTVDKFDGELLGGGVFIATVLLFLPKNLLEES